MRGNGVVTTGAAAPSMSAGGFSDLAVAAVEPLLAALPSARGRARPARHGPARTSATAQRGGSPGERGRGRTGLVGPARGGTVTCPAAAPRRK